MFNRSITYIVLFILVFYSCSHQPVDEYRKQTILVSLAPQKYLIETLSDSLFEVDVMLPPGASPATYEPTPKQVRSISSAFAYVKMGHLVFEKTWLPSFRSINPDLVIVDQSEGCKLIKGHGHGKQENKNGIDPHVWTSPKEMKKQVNNIFNFLVQTDSLNTKRLKRNRDDFYKRIDSLDRTISEMFSETTKKHFLIFHPALSYFARDYGLIQLSIEHEGKSPSLKHMDHLIHRSREIGINTIFVQKQFPRSRAESIARELNANILVIDPLAYNWYDNMLKMAQLIHQSLNE